MQLADMSASRSGGNSEKGMAKIKMPDMRERIQLYPGL